MCPKGFSHWNSHLCYNPFRRGINNAYAYMHTGSSPDHYTNMLYKLWKMHAKLNRDKTQATGYHAYMYSTPLTVHLGTYTQILTSGNHQLRFWLCNKTFYILNYVAMHFDIYIHVHDFFVDGERNWRSHKRHILSLSECLHDVSFVTDTGWRLTSNIQNT